MKKTKIVVPALAVLLLSTAASVSGTVAWFSMNNSVTVTGMTVTTKVSSNLQIAGQNLEANYGDILEQARSGILEPASSTDGASFFYTVKGKGDGKATAQGEAGASTYTAYDEANGTTLANTYAAKQKYDAAFNTAYGFSSPSIRESASDPDNVCYGYIDYSFYLKGGYSNANHRINMTKCEMKYKGESVYGAIETAWAWRVGMFAQKCEANDDNTTVTDATAVAAGVKTVLKFASSANQTTNQAVNGLDDGDLAAVTNANQPATIDTAPTVNTTQRYKVIVRLWLEGEDTSCTSSTFAELTKDWKLDLEFKLGLPSEAGYAAVTQISTAA